MKYYRDSRNILIFGGTNGIGLELAKYAHDNNYKLIIVCKSNKNIKTAKKYLGKSKNYKIIINNCYLGKFNNIHKFCKTFFKGKINYMVSFLGTGKFEFGLSKNIKKWREVFEKNFFINVKITLEFLKYFKKRDFSSCIIFTGAIAGVERLNAPMTYSISKTSLISFANHLAHELLDHKIRVLSVSPGNVFFKNGRWEEIIKKNKKIIQSYIKKDVGMKRLGTAKELAYLYFSLMSENNSFMSGTNIIADGLQIKKIL